ncbi:MAG: UPF0104 family protein [Alphaproteobacteria bacterium]|jgi:uncharacterized membrane protein YbhN (UPF0104 family)|nr:UPF0104 family protein [Alphaproteobacteria bacterium]
MTGTNISKDTASTWRTALTRGAPVIVPLGLLALILYAVGTDDILDRIRSVAPVWVVAAFLAAQAQIVLSALRWQVTARHLGITFSFSRALAEYYLSGAVNMTLPGGVLGDGLRAVRSRQTMGLEPAAHAVVIERLAGQVALVAVLALGLLLSGRPGLQAAGGLLLGLMIVALFVLPRSRRGISWPAFPGGIGRFIVSVKIAWGGRRNAVLQVVLGVLIVTANLASFAFVAAATGLYLNVLQVLFAVPLVLLAMLLPFSVAGWGYREGAAAAVFPMIGATAAEGVGASILFGAVILVANVPGLFVFKSRQRRDRRAAEPDTKQAVE